jgi:pimeloyl-ACP methyl ester carboxylesterase
VKIALLHAYPLDERMWEPQLDALRDYEVVTPRLYGHGGSVDHMAASVLAEEPEGELVLAGASLGGYVALAMAELEPTRIRALALVGARADADSAERRAGRAETRTLIEAGGAEALWENQRSRLLLDSAPEDAVDLARRCALDRSIDELLEALDAIRDRADRSGTLAAFGGPVLVAVGEGDLFFPPEEAQRQAQSAPHGRFRAFGGARHLPSLEQADEFNAALAGFLADV